MLIKFLRDGRGNFTVLSAVMMTSLVGVAGLVTDYGNGLFNRLEDQRLADTAAVAGARVYDETQSQSAVTTAVTGVAALNGVAGGNVSSSIVTSPSGDGNQAVKVIVTSRAPRYLSQLLMGPASSSIPVSASSYAEMKPGGAGCVIALKTSGTGVTVNGGATLSAPGCAVASDQTINCHSSTNTITTKFAYYDTAALNCSYIVPPTGYTLTETEAYTADPLAGTSEVLGQTGRLASVAAIASPNAPTIPSGTALAFTSSYPNTTLTNALTAQGCAGSYSSPTWTVTCTGSLATGATNNGTYTFGNVSVASGVTVNFSVGGPAANIYNFAQVSSGGGVMNFGSGTYNIAQGILTTNGSSNIAISFAAGTFNVGYPASSTSCNSSYSYSICWGGGTLSFAGPSTFVLAGGIYAKASTSVTLGSIGTAGSFNIGKAHDGNSLYVGNGANVILGDANGGSDIFKMAGNVNSGGGSCFELGAATQHDINGYVLTAGGSILGAGVYTLTDYISLGGGNGGNVTCWGTSTGLTATGVSLVVGGSVLDTSDCTPACAFYVGAGYDTVTLTAPTSGSTQGLAVIGPTSSTNTATAVFTEGASNTSISGAFYFPYGTISQSGSSHIGDGSGQCLELIGAQVTLQGGASTASSCNIPGVGTAGSSGLVSLVQ